MIDDEIAKTVIERRMEIEQRLTGEPVIIERKHETSTSKDDTDPIVASKLAEVPVEPIEPTEVSFEHKRMSFERGVSIEQVLHEDIPIREKLTSMKEKKMPSVEEKSIDGDVDAVSLTFHEKRLSFEQGIPVKEIIQKKTEEVILTSELIPEEHEKQSTPVSETDKSTDNKVTTSTEGNFKTINRCYL